MILHLHQQAFIQALLSTVVSLKDRVSVLFAKSVSRKVPPWWTPRWEILKLGLQIPGKCISDTISDFKGHIAHR